MTQRTKWALIVIAILIVLGVIFYRPLLKLIFKKTSDGGTPIIIKGGDGGEGSETAVVLRTGEYQSIGQSTLSSRFSSDTVDTVKFTEVPDPSSGIMKCLQSFSFGKEIDEIDVELKTSTPNPSVLKIYEGANGYVYIKYAPPVVTSTYGLSCPRCIVTAVTCKDDQGTVVKCNNGNYMGPWIHINDNDKNIGTCPP